MSVNAKVSYSSLVLGDSKSKTSVYGERKEDNFAIINYLKDYQIPVTSSEDSGANRNFVFGTTFEKAVYSDGDLGMKCLL